MSKIFVKISDIPNIQTNKKVEAVNHRIASLQGIEKYNQITQINFSKNRLNEIGNYLKGLKGLIVINLGYNKIKSLKGVQGLENLKALVMNNNEIEKITCLEGMPDLNTLIISNNLISEISGFAHVKQLLKLNLSHNKLKSLDGIEKLTSLKELKVNNNQISCLPNKFKSLKQLSILDLGRNQFKELKDISNLKGLAKLTNLNIYGNELEVSQEDAQNLGLKLKLLNNKKIEDGLVHGDEFYQRLRINKQLSKGQITQEEADLQLKEIENNKKNKKKSSNKDKKEKQKNPIVEKQDKKRKIQKKQDSDSDDDDDELDFQNQDDKQVLEKFPIKKLKDNNGDEQEITMLEKKNLLALAQKKQEKVDQKNKAQEKSKITRIEKNTKQQKDKQKPVNLDMFSNQQSKQVQGWD